MRVYSQIVKEVTEEFIEQNTPLPEESVCAEKVVDELNSIFELENSIRPKGAKFKLCTDLPLLALEIFISCRDDIALIVPGDKSLSNKPPAYSTEQKKRFPVGIYQKSGANEGVWEVTNDPLGEFAEKAKRYKPDLSVKQLTELFTAVKLRLKVLPKCVIPYYVAVENCIVDVLHKKFLPFTPDLVFTNKIHTPIDANATNPHVYFEEDGTTLDVESWLKELGDEETVLTILEVIQRACIPLARHDKMCLFYNTQGNNGKGTICQLIRNIIGEDFVANISLSKFSDNYGLANLPKATAIICDENNMGYIKGLAELKAVITADKVTVNDKYVKAFDYTFNGLVLQCVNELPKVDDKTGSFKRRLHIIPFHSCFTESERKYIKGRFIHMDSVKKYILKKVLLDMEYRESFTETSLTKSALAEYSRSSNSVVEFLEEILPQCRWNLLPATDFLYEMYKSWYRKISPSGKSIGRNDFIDDVKDFVIVSVKENPAFEWEWTNSTRADGYIDPNVREPLLVEYQITTMASPMQIGCNHPYPDRLKAKYSGLKRRSFAVQQSNTPTEN